MDNFTLNNGRIKMDDKLVNIFKQAVINFKDNPIHETFKEVAIAAAKIKPETIDDLRELYKMPIRIKKGELAFGSTKQNFDTLPMAEITRAVENMIPQILQ